MVMLIPADVIASTHLEYPPHDASGLSILSSRLGQFGYLTLTISEADMLRHFAGMEQVMRNGYPLEIEIPWGGEGYSAKARGLLDRTEYSPVDCTLRVGIFLTAPLDFGGAEPVVTEDAQGCAYLKKPKRLLLLDE